MSIQKLSSGGFTGGKFKSAGFVTNKKFVPVEALVLAGGGSGNGHNGPGGGAGGYRSSYQSDAISGGGGAVENKLQIFSGVDFTVTVGAGGSLPSASQGSPGAGTLSNGTNGSDSVFTSITSIGGGKATAQGGSNGGAATGATSATGQGFPGSASGQYRGGGGGGAGAAGSGSGSHGNSPGGAGVSSTITGAAVTRGGGGGGGRDNYFNSGTSAGGAGGGGVGRQNTTGQNGSTNYGGGGGGGGTLSLGQSWRGGAGGSGVVILRYPDTSTLTVGAGLTATTATDGSDKVTTFTAGTGTVSFT